LGNWRKGDQLEDTGLDGDNIKIDFQEVRWEDMDWIDLAQDGVRWWALLNEVMNIRVP